MLFFAGVRTAGGATALIDIAITVRESRSAQRGITSALPLVQRAFDLLVGTIALLVFSPIMAMVAAAVYIEDGGPIFFVQQRVGAGGRHFPFIKFRSMAQDAERRMVTLLNERPDLRAEYALNRKLRNDPRITSVGRWIRRHSLDELPQLLNVLAGHMSIVGPRPILLGEQAAYGSRLRFYCRVRPGLTGLWQVSGRSHATFRSRVAMDVIYVRRKSPLMDLRILVATVPAVLFGTGSY